MSLLVEILSSWNARQGIQDLLEVSGFSAHIPYQDEIRVLAEATGPLGVEELERYWSESGREWVACAGKVDSLNRQFGEEVGYRSAYLDELADRGRARGYEVSPGMHPAERVIAFEPEVGNRLVGRVLSEVARVKEEVTRRDARGMTRTSSMNDLLRYLGNSLKDYGFEHGSTRLKCRSSSGMRFEIGFSMGKSKILYQLPLFLKVWHGSKTRPFLYASDFVYILPGFRYYSIVRDDWDICYGLDAYACLIRLFCRSLDELCV
ncbi:hypothetical protein [Pinirhizobacter soli]|uniref:hypothetical protein n=1 Tax=Pinirhizobacter soli TaxID=2786953 RepID=UPI00202A40E8|nr:hypothetical protein [Pinirhizobacter soli]